ncbi:MAG: M24 family metallopeptidase [Armatimonadota bacterium]
MSADAPSGAQQSSGLPQILPMRQRAETIRRVLEKRLDTILPLAMRETGFDMWLILCQEDDLDPVFTTLIPMDTWCPILQMLIFCDRGTHEGVERINLSMTNTGGLYDQPWKGQRDEEQWPLLREIIEVRDPKRIGINTGAIQWAAGGLTHNLYTQLVEALPPRHVDRLASAEPLAARWAATLTDEEIELHEHVVAVAHHLLTECYSRKALTPGVTTTEDLEWYYWQRCADLGLEVAFRPFFVLARSEAMCREFGEDDRVIRPGDFVRSDVGIRYLRLHSDHQQWAYVLREGDSDAPEGMKRLMAEANRLQDIFMAEFRQGLTGNELLSTILTRARSEGLPNPRVYSHSLGLFLHEPGPLIGLPWEQERCPGRGDVTLEHNQCFTMELSVRGEVPEWNGQEVTMGIEEDVAFTKEGCRPLDGRQTEFHLV